MHLDLSQCGSVVLIEIFVRPFEEQLLRFLQHQPLFGSLFADFLSEAVDSAHTRMYSGCVATESMARLETPRTMGTLDRKLWHFFFHLSSLRIGVNKVVRLFDCFHISLGYL